MSRTRLRWSDARGAADRLQERPGDRRLLLLLALLSLAPERVIEQLEGLRGGSSIYRRLAHLAGEGLVAAVRPPIRPGHGPGLWYLTDLGLAVVALDQGRDPVDLARSHRLRRSDLLARLPGLPQLLASYEILGALAASGPGRPDLLAWERPWHRRVPTRSARAALAVTLPAYAALGWKGEVVSCFLVPDLAAAPVRFFRSAMRGLLAHRALGIPLPTLLVATTHAGRMAAWHELLEDVARERAEVPMVAEITTWEEVRRGHVPCAALRSQAVASLEGQIPRAPVRLFAPRSERAVLPRLVGSRLDTSTKDHTVDPRAAILQLGVGDRVLLDFVGRHPFLSIDELALALGRDMVSLGKCVRRATDLGFLRNLDPNEWGTGTCHPRMVELTTWGLEVVAAQRGLSLAAAVRLHGLVGGGPAQPSGPRRKLVSQLAHTRGVDGVFLRLIAQARASASRGSDEALLDWRNAAASTRGAVRPDGYGLYRRAGRLYGFFLEYDRGTMGDRAYRAKLAAYINYLVSGRFSRDYDGFPTILVVAVSNSAEERIARAACLVGVGQPTPLPLLLTSWWRVVHKLNPLGLLGPIWREPYRDFEDRRYWLSPSGVT